MKVCPFSAFLFLSSAAAYTLHAYHKDRKASKMEETKKKYHVVFVLGGPGAGKGTQCDMIIKNNPQWAHLSAGDLLRAERKNNDSELATLINSKISSGQIVPAEITVRLLEKAMEESNKTYFLIDGFPRSEGNVIVWEEKMACHQIEFVLFLDCPEEIMTNRIVLRGQTSGRIDDNLSVLKKRFETFRRESMPIINRYDKMGKVKKVLADGNVDDVYAQVIALFNDL